MKMDEYNCDETYLSWDYNYENRFTATNTCGIHVRKTSFDHTCTNGSDLNI